MGFFFLQYLLFLFRRRKTSFWGKSWRRWRRTIQTNWTSGSRWINLHRVRQLFFQLFLAAWSVNRKRLNQHIDKPRMAIEISPVLSTLFTGSSKSRVNVQLCHCSHYKLIKRNYLWLKEMATSPCETPQWSSLPLVTWDPAVTRFPALTSYIHRIIQHSASL